MNFFRRKCKKSCHYYANWLSHRPRATGPQELQMAGDKKGAEQRGGGVSALSHLEWGIVNPFRFQREPRPL